MTTRIEIPDAFAIPDRSLRTIAGRIVAGMPRTGITATIEDDTARRRFDGVDRQGRTLLLNW